MTGPLSGCTAAEVQAALGAVVRRRRLHLGLTQEQLSDRARIGRQLVNRCERGHWGPRLDTLCRLATALRTRPSALLADAEDALAERRVAS